MRIRVKMVLADGTSSDEICQGTTIAIGRDPKCEIAVDAARHTQVSWMHARLACDGDALLVHDCNSKNGTYVNEQPVEGTAPLRVGDTLQLGRKGPKYVLLEFTPGDVPDQADAVTPPGAMMVAAPAPVSREENFGSGSTTGKEPVRWAVLAGGGLAVVALLLLMARLASPPTVIVMQPGDGPPVQSERPQAQQDSTKPREDTASARAASTPAKPQDAPKDAPGTGNHEKHKEKGSVATVPPPEKKKSVEGQLQDAVYLVQLERYNEFIPFVTCCAIDEHVLLTSAREAAQLVHWRKNGTFHRIWVVNQTGSAKFEVEEIRAHRTFAQLVRLNEGEKWIYFNLALLTVKEKLPSIVPLASAESLRQLESGLPLTCLGFSHDGKKITKYNPPKLQVGKNNHIYTITTVPAPQELPFADEPPRLLHLDGEVPHVEVDVPQSNSKVVMPAYGSPVVNQHGELVAVYGATMEPPKGQELLIFHYAAVICPKLIRLWLEKEDTQTWVLPDLLPASSGAKRK
jgi:hypothetical protein